MAKPLKKAIEISKISISILNKKTGIVILVGKAARLVIRHITMATIAVTNRNILFPDMTTKRIVNGVRKHPCSVRIAASQPKRYFSWLLVHIIKRVITDCL